MKVIRLARVQALLAIVFVFLVILFLYKFVTKTSSQETDSNIPSPVTSLTTDVHKSLPQSTAIARVET